MIEVEVKAPLTGAVEAKVKEYGTFIREESQTDAYFQHPSHDFRKTDEALRVRAVGSEYYVTYKGPKAASNLKKRREVEFPVSEKIFNLLESLGFTQTLVVKKARKYYSVDGLEVALDEVERLGRFIEIESKKTGDEKKIMELAEKLGIKKQSCTTKSYTELLDEKR